LPTNQLTVSQVVDWSTRGLDDSQTSKVANSEFGRKGATSFRD